MFENIVVNDSQLLVRARLISAAEKDLEAVPRLKFMSRLSVTDAALVEAIQ